MTIFDIVYNIHGNHDFAIRCTSTANNMTFGNKATLADGDFKVKIECYKEIALHTVGEALILIKGALYNKSNVEIAIYRNDTWILQVLCDGTSRNIWYELEYSYKDGSQGKVNIVNNNGKLTKSMEYVNIPKDVKQKLLSMEKQLGRRAWI